DLVRVGQHRLVGLEDLRVLVGVAVHLLRDLRQGVALLHGVHARGAAGGGDVQTAVVHLGDAVDIAERQDDLLLLGLRVHLPAHVDGLLRDLDLQALDVEAERLDLVLERTRALGLHVGIGGLGGFRGVRSEELFPGFPDEIDQAHGTLLQALIKHTSHTLCTPSCDRRDGLGTGRGIVGERWMTSPLDPCRGRHWTAGTRSSDCASCARRATRWSPSTRWIPAIINPTASCTAACTAAPSSRCARPARGSTRWRADARSSASRTTPASCAPSGAERSRSGRRRSRGDGAASSGKRSRVTSRAASSLPAPLPRPRRGAGGRGGRGEARVTARRRVLVVAACAAACTGCLWRAEKPRDTGPPVDYVR